MSANRAAKILYSLIKTKAISPLHQNRLFGIIIFSSCLKKRRSARRVLKKIQFLEKFTFRGVGKREGEKTVEMEKAKESL